MKNIEKLNNPVWYSLSESLQEYAIDCGNIKFYEPDYAPFGGFIRNENIIDAITQYSKRITDFLIVGEKPDFSNAVKLKTELVGLQMIIYNTINIPITHDIIKLNNNHKAKVIALVTLAYPEYFKKNTFNLGNYYGIFKDVQLVAITGERMQMNNYIEVSAVITHPDHTGKGYAKQLVAHAVNNIFMQNKTPFLHVAKSNVGAIKLYEKLGFQTRREISFWNFTS